MNTNTVEQAERLKKLGVEFGPALTLDELHRVFLDVIKEWPAPGESTGDDTWDLNRPALLEYDRTSNHAADWTEILIWILEKGHVTANQVNEVLK